MASPTIFTPIAVDPVQLGIAASTLYTAGANGAVLDELILVNDDSTTSATATIYYVPDGGEAGDTNIIAKAITIPCDGFPVNILSLMDISTFHMEAGGTIQGLASAANQITCHIGGVDYA